MTYCGAVPGPRRTLGFGGRRVTWGGWLVVVTACWSSLVVAEPVGPVDSSNTPVATEPEASDAHSGAPTDEGQPVCVVLRNASTEVPDEAFLSALAHAFGPTPVVRDCPNDGAPVHRLSVVYAPEQRELTVTFTASNGSEMMRVLEAPQARAEAPEISAVVALELSRRQVGSVSPPEKALTPATPGTSGDIAHPQLALSSALAPTEDPKRKPDAPSPPRKARIANAAFFYPLAVNYDDPNIKTALDFNLLYGVVGEVEGLQLGAFNDVRGPMQGLQLGWFVNGNSGPLRGVSVAGVFGAAESLNVGLQMGGALVLSNGATEGMQVALGGSLSRGALRGIQLAGLLNATSGSSQGIQATLGGNVAKNITGLQVSPLFNYAQNVTGLQLGLVNVGKKVRGTQIGLVNVAADVEGVPIGLVSVTKSGGVHLSAWASNTTLVNVGIRLATRYTYSMFTLGYHPTSTSDALGPGIVFGARFPVRDKVAVDVDVGGEYLLGAKLCCYEDPAAEQTARERDRSHYRLRVIPTWQPHPHFSVFAGGGVAMRVPFAFYAGLDDGDRTVKLGPEVLFGVSL